MKSRISSMLFLLGFATVTLAQNFEENGICQPVFNGQNGQNDGATGYLLFDVQAADIGFFVSDLEFVADISGEFDVSQVLTFSGSAFDPDRTPTDPSTMIVTPNDNITLTTTAGQPFRLGFTPSMAFEVPANSIVGVQVNFDDRDLTSNPMLARYTLATNAPLALAANAVNNGDVVRMWGSLSTTTGLAFVDGNTVNNVIFHGGVCVTNLEQRRFTTSLTMSTDEVVPNITTPAPDAMDAMGTCVVTFDEDSFEISFSVEFSDLSSAPESIGLYLPAMRGERVNNAQFSISPLPNAISGTVSSNNVDNLELYRINPTQRDALFNGLWYCQINTQLNRQGELRAQVENFTEATQTTSFPLTVEALQIGLDGDFDEDLVLTQRAELVAGTPILVAVPGATATAEITFDGLEPDLQNNRVQYGVSFSGLSGNVTFAHFHRAARNNAQANVLLIDISDNIVNDPANPGSGTINGVQNRLNNEEVQDALAGLWYLNLHTAANPAGEVRAQVNRAQATVIASAGSAFATITTDNSANTNTIRLQVEYSGLSSLVTSAELRGPVIPDLNETPEEGTSPVVVLRTTARSEQGDGQSGILSGVITESPSILNQLRTNNQYYVVLRTEANDFTGELRGSVPMVSVPDSPPLPPSDFQAIVPLSVGAEIIALDENSIVPPLGIPDSLLNANSSGQATITYDASTGLIAWDISFQNLSSTLVAAHLHGPAVETATGPVRVNIPILDAQGMPLPSPIRGSIQISDNFAREAIAGFWYVNVHTLNNPLTGEIRGQIVAEVGPVNVVIDAPPPPLLVQRAGPIPLTRAAAIAGGATVTPALDGPDNIGSATVTVFPANATVAWEISYGTLSSDVTLIHFHGPALANEQAGVRVEVFGGPAGQSVNPNIGMTVLPDPMINDAFIDELVGGLWYINVHTVDNPAGEIRGQVVGFQQVAVDLQGPDIATNPPVVDANGSSSKSISVLLLATAALVASISTF